MTPRADDRRANDAHPPAIFYPLGLLVMFWEMGYCNNSTYMVAIVQW